MIVQAHSYPRAALLGNPSDEYDSNVFDDIGELAEDVDFFGYYGGMRLLKAAIKRFYYYSVDENIELHNRNFTIRYSSSIPYRLGLAGSSAIITACIKALMQFYRVNIPKYEMAGLVLTVESDEQEIPAGLQDRVIQAYKAPVYMDFNKVLTDSRGYGDYQLLDKEFLGIFRLHTRLICRKARKWFITISGRGTTLVSAKFTGSGVRSSVCMRTKRHVRG